VATPAPTSPAGPTSLLELRDLRARRSELSSQIGNVTSRRDELASQLRNAAPGADRAGIEARIGVLDKRILELEDQLNVTGRQLANARGVAATVEDPPGPASAMPDADQMTAIVIVFTIAVLMPLSIAWARAIFRRARHATERPSPELQQRLDRMEEGIDAIAIEVERISEGQRFVSKLLGEGAARELRVEAGGVEPAARATAAAAKPGR
jgi:chromosome segregation ATPase